MSHFTYNLKKLSIEEQQERYDAITKISQAVYNNSYYFAYLPYISNPTNNYQKYTITFLNSLIVELTYGSIDADYHSPELKRQFVDFIKEYQYNAQTYIREKQEEMIRLQEQQMAAMQYNATTQPVVFYANQNNQQYQQQPQQEYRQQYPQQQYGQQQQYEQQGGYNNRQQQGYPYSGQQQGQPQHRGERKFNNRGDGQYQPREQHSRGEHQPHREYQNHHQFREHQQGEREHGHSNNYRGQRKFHEKKSQEHYSGQYSAQQYYPQQNQDPNHEDHHHWHKFHTRAGQIMTFESRAEFEEFARFKEKYGIAIQIRYDPEDKLTAQLEQEKLPEPVVVPEVIPEPVVVPEPPAPKPEPKPRKFTIEEIKQFINSVSKEELEKHANPEVVGKANEISSWQTQEIEVEQKQDKYKRNNEMKKPAGDRGDRGDRNKDQAIKTGVRKDEAKIAESLGYKGAENKVVQITIGKNETLETRKIKDEIKNMAGRDFATLKEKEYENMDQVEKCRKEIIYNLNLIVPENLKDIQKDIIVYLFDDANVCRSLIEEIIKKAWDQPKYASTYAKLCSDFSKRHPNDFKFEGQKGGKKDNPFKYFLIERVQHSFDQKIEKFPEFESPEDKEIFLKEKKKNILSNVKFIAELIIHKVLKKRTIKYCISQLFESFLGHYYAFKHDNKIEDSVFDYHFEAIIEFIQNIGETYEQLGEKEKEVIPYDFFAIRDHVAEILNLTSAPNTATLDTIEHFNGDEYFRLLDFINGNLIRKNFPRLSALLQNLVERRGNKWQKHLSSSDGPKKLKEIQEDILREDDDTQGKGKEKLSKEKMELEKLDKKVKELFEGWEMDKKEELREIREILRKTNERTFYLSFLKQVADEKKDNIVKRVALFAVILGGDRFSFNEFRNAWFDIIKYLAIGSGDYPYCGAALANILKLILEKEGNLDEFWKKYNVDDEEDELYFIEEVFQKYYHYTQDEKALKFVKPKTKMGGLI